MGFACPRVLGRRWWVLGRQWLNPGGASCVALDDLAKRPLTFKPPYVEPSSRRAVEPHVPVKRLKTRSNRPDQLPIRGDRQVLHPRQHDKRPVVPGQRQVRDPLPLPPHHQVRPRSPYQHVPYHELGVQGTLRSLPPRKSFRWLKNALFLLRHEPIMLWTKGKSALAQMAFLRKSFRFGLQLGYPLPVASRCYFVPGTLPGQDGQYQWWNLRDEGVWVCDMWMNAHDGVMRCGDDSRESETSVPSAYFQTVGNAMVRVW